MIVRPRNDPALGLAGLVVIACVAVMATGCGSSSSRTSVSTHHIASSTRSPEPFRFFAANSIWNQPLEAADQVDPASVSIVRALSETVAEEEQLRDGPWINTTSYSVPIYTVPANQPTVPVTLVEVREPALSAAWRAVPLPSNARPAVGTDGSLVVSQPSTDRLWEFWRLVHDANGRWHARWGGAMEDVSTSSGVYSSAAWPGAKPWWGVSASSLSIAGGLITLEDLERGKINHALAMSVPHVRGGVYASPARRDDGSSSDPLSLPEGAHLRLDPNLDLTTLHLPKLTMMLAEAAQRYGIYVRDGSPVIAFYAQDPTPTDSEPYKGAGGYFDGQYPFQLLASFPWSHLEVLKLELHPYHHTSDRVAIKGQAE
jgi:hypothetical protein